MSLADTYTNMANRLKFVTENAAQLEAVQKRLFEISQTTRVDLRDTTELYSRMAFALRDLGPSQNQVLKFTENLNKALTLSGAAGAEASGALIQLSQGLASGVLRGQELNSILEQTPYIASLIAKQLGVTTGELRSLGQQGKITGKAVFDAMINASQELDDKFKDTVPTVSQGMTSIGNSALNLVGRFNEATGSGQKFAEVLQKIAKGIDGIDFRKLERSQARGKPFGATGGVLGLAHMFGILPNPMEQGEWETSVTPNMDATTEAVEADAAGREARLKQLAEHWDNYNRSYRTALQDMLDLDTTPIGDKIDAITDAWQRGMISHRDYEKSMRKVKQQQSQIMDDLLTQTVSTGRAIFGENKKFAIAEAAISTYQGVSKALGAYPPPFNFAMAALVAAQGFAQVASIRSTNPGSGAGSTSISTGGATSAGSAGGGESSEGGSSPGSARAINVSLVGRMFDREQVRELIEGLNDAIADGARLYVNAA
ncbi:tape measure protein [Hyphomicrobium sulfonivorans]|uniref:tape measure protein n=1 Tax=Hyphomicrobium sulfonivorans TaxID=121290 RepID=UPI0018DCDD5E|nr:tape measure protein [Hyphomicrobium sulfonivorans]